MSYYEDVYLKRINLDGLNQQERVKTRKEKEFEKLFLRKTEYQAKVYQINDEEKNIIVSLQPNKWNETQLISNLLVSTREKPFKTGDILYIFQKIKQIEYNKIWLILFCEENITKGYYCYKVICLDSTVNIINEYGDSLYTIPVKFVNATSQLVKDYFSYNKTNYGYREPEKDFRFITKDFDFLTKDRYFNYKERGWQITGKDNISIDGVAYTGISERLIREPEPKSSENIQVGEEENFFLNNR